MTVLRESVIDTSGAEPLYPGVDQQRLRRWIRRGVRGVKLEALRVGGRWLTSREAIERFLRKCNPDLTAAAAQEQPQPVPATAGAA